MRAGRLRGGSRLAAVTDLSSEDADIDRALTSIATTPDRYATAGVAHRRQMNQLWFGHLTIDNHDGEPVVTDATRTEPAAQFHAAASEIATTVPDQSNANSEANGVAQAVSSRGAHQAPSAG